VTLLMPKPTSIPTTAQSLGSLLKSARDIMRKDKGLNGDLDRLPMLTWIMFLKFLDDLELQREGEAKLTMKKFKPAIEPPYRWRDWAAKSDGITGDELLAFINNEETTIVRLPNGVFAPYTSIPTNILFFDRSGPTREVWYYEQPLPEGRNQIGHGLRFEQAVGSRFLDEGVRQIELDGDAHNALLAEGCRNESRKLPRLIHTDTHPTFDPRAGKTKHPRRTKVKPAGASENVAQPSRLRVRAASRGAKERRAGTPGELAGADACATI
jgi:hypothetical protein